MTLLEDLVSLSPPQLLLNTGTGDYYLSFSIFSPLSPASKNVVLVDIVELEDSLAGGRMIRSNIDVLVHFSCNSPMTEWSC